MTPRVCSCGKPARNEVTLLRGIVPVMAQMACARHTPSLRERFEEGAAEDQRVDVFKI